MLQKRLMLLGASLVAFGAITVGGAIAFTLTPDTEVIGNTTVFAPTAPTLDAIPAATVPANNAYHKIADIKNSEADVNYDFLLTDVSITSEGSSLGCGLYDYAFPGPTDSVTNLAGIGPVINGSSIDSLVDLYVKIDPSGTDPSCTISGGVVTATYQIAP